MPTCNFVISLVAGAGALVSFGDLLCAPAPCPPVSFEDFFVCRR